MHFHFTPEVFIQVGGTTQFRFPESQLRLQPGQICVLPTGLPHGEIATAGRQPFSNLVLMLAPGTAQWHLAIANKDGRPLTGPYRGSAPADSQQLAAYLSTVTELAATDTPHARLIQRSLMLAVLARFAQLIAQPQSPTPPNAPSPLVARCQLDVTKRLSDPALNVQFLAARIPCSPNYLSHRFRQETGTNLISYIHQQRVAQACRLIGSTRLTTKELAHAVGFLDPTYFIRVFRRLTGRTPGSYRL
jgi:AraC-like DNA-binding protein